LMHVVEDGIRIRELREQKASAGNFLNFSWW
jgi:hypothetical protein